MLGRACNAFDPAGPGECILHHLKSQPRNNQRRFSDPANAADRYQQPMVNNHNEALQS